jgi:hypothetical protein
MLPCSTHFLQKWVEHRLAKIPCLGSYSNISFPPRVDAIFDKTLRMAEEIINTMDPAIIRYSFHDVSQRIQAQAPPRPATDRRTSVEGTLIVSKRDHCYSLAFNVAIVPVANPPHTYFNCENIGLTFCCSPRSDQTGLIEKALKDIEKFLSVVYPQVVCSLCEVERCHLCPAEI